MIELSMLFHKKNGIELGSAKIRILPHLES